MTSVELYLVFHTIGSLLGFGYMWQLYPLNNRNYKKELLNRIASSLLLGLFLSWIIVGVGYYNMSNGKKHYPKRNNKGKFTKDKDNGN